MTAAGDFGAVELAFETGGVRVMQKRWTRRKVHPATTQMEFAGSCARADCGKIMRRASVGEPCPTVALKPGAHPVVMNGVAGASLPVEGAPPPKAERECPIAEGSRVMIRILNRRHCRKHCSICSRHQARRRVGREKIRLLRTRAPSVGCRLRGGCSGARQRRGRRAVWPATTGKEIHRGRAGPARAKADCPLRLSRA